MVNGTQSVPPQPLTSIMFGETPPFSENQANIQDDSSHFLEISESCLFSLLDESLKIVNEIISEEESTRLAASKPSSAQ